MNVQRLLETISAALRQHHQISPTCFFLYSRTGSFLPSLLMLALDSLSVYVSEAREKLHNFGNKVCHLTVYHLGISVVRWFENCSSRYMKVEEEWIELIVQGTGAKGCTHCAEDYTHCVEDWIALRAALIALRTVLHWELSEKAASRLLMAW